MSLFYLVGWRAIIAYIHYDDDDDDDDDDYFVIIMTETNI